MLAGGSYLIEMFRDVAAEVGRLFTSAAKHHVNGMRIKMSPVVGVKSK